MESDFQQHPHVFLNSGHEPQRHHLHHHQHHQQQMSSGLTRFRSAPSSFFANLLDRDFCEEFLNRPSSPETERLLARIISGNRDDSSAQNHDSFQPSSPPQNEANYHRQSQFVAEPVKSEVDVIPQLQQTQQQNNYSSGSHYQNPSPQPPLPSRNMSYGVVRSSGTDRLPPMKAGGSNSNLIRQSSSPAGLFANINIDSGYVSMEGMGNLIGGNGANAEASFSTANRLSNNNMNYSSRPAASMGHMSPIAELGDKPMRRASIQEGAAFGEGHGNNYVTSYPMSSWDDSTGVSESFNVLKRGRDEDGKTYSALEHANEEVRERPPLGLAHHLSLPKASDISAVEKFLQLQDSVPCKIRAKRGCATHPRSIAERVRRTKISERMRRLQDLVPNMDKQTNTADMLDLAVDYIKDLQKQVKDLSATRARCTCSRMQQL